MAVSELCEKREINNVMHDERCEHTGSIGALQSESGEQLSTKERKKRIDVPPLGHR